MAISLFSASAPTGWSIVTPFVLFGYYNIKGYQLTVNSCHGEGALATVAISYQEHEGFQVIAVTETMPEQGLPRLPTVVGMARNDNGGKGSRILTLTGITA